MTSQTSPSSLRNIPLAAWWILALMTIDSILGMIDRNAVSVLKTTLKGVFQIDDTHYGLLVTAFTIPFAFFYVVTGRWADRYGSRLMLTVFVLIWSLASIGCGLSQSFEQMVVGRAILGAAEAGLLPASMIALVTWFPRDRIATAYAIKNPLQALGPILTPPIVASLAIAYGWRSAFILPGLIGLVFAMLWWMADRNPPKYSSSQPPVEVPVHRVTIWSIFQRRELWGILLFRFMSDPIWFFFQYWQAGYLQEHLGASLADVGRLLWIPPAINAIATFGTAAWSERLLRQGRTGAAARLRVMIFIMPLAFLIALLPVINDIGMTVAIFTTTYILSYTWLYLSISSSPTCFPGMRLVPQWGWSIASDRREQPCSTC